MGSREAVLCDTLPGGAVRCRVCQWQCRIQPGKRGVCRMRRNIEGKVELLNYAEVSSMAVDPIEKKPLFHFFPGSRVLSLGGWGCNFMCRHCQNWEISAVEEPGGTLRLSRQVSPEEAVSAALKEKCRGISWTYNEPSVWFEYTLDSARLARDKGLYTVYVTNGYLSKEALDMIGPYLDAWRVDVKGFSPKVYSHLARVPEYRGILEVAERAHQKWDMHVEVITNIIPKLNDDPRQLGDIANWIKDHLGDLTPWHITRFYPYHKLTELPPTPVSTLEMAYRTGKEKGLKFVYLGNVPGHEYENTVCYNCNNLNIKRHGYSVELVGTDGSHCRHCGADLNIRLRTGSTDWRS